MILFCCFDYNVGGTAKKEENRKSTLAGHNLRRYKTQLHCFKIAQKCLITHDDTNNCQNCTFRLTILTYEILVPNLISKYCKMRLYK